jgi:hypothetical protein
LITALRKLAQDEREAFSTRTRWRVAPKRVVRRMVSISARAARGPQTGRTEGRIKK